MKYKIGELVKEGGPQGPISIVRDYKNGIYTLVSIDGKATGYLNEDTIYKCKQFEQLKLF